jgi:delta-aminolevulinic acid dehydratase/porphobilinogen synthase
MSFTSRGNMKTHCGGCAAKITESEAEACWFCNSDLCFDCWDETGHCGHAEADRINEETRKIYAEFEEGKE